MIEGARKDGQLVTSEWQLLQQRIDGVHVREVLHVPRDHGVITEMYRTAEDTKFLEVTYQNGDKEVLYFKDFSSGAMIENIVRRAKKLSIKRQIAGEGKGIRPRVASACDGLLALPRKGEVDSLNVSAAATALLFEAVRQR